MHQRTSHRPSRAPHSLANLLACMNPGKLARTLTVAVGVACGTSSLAALPPVPVPPENPITEQKRVLGKILFFDEQLSHDNTMACATCHSAARGGADARPRARNPGADGAFNTPDDVLGSSGVVASDAVRNYLRSAVYGLAPQVTGRSSMAPINAAFASDLFWDGRATSAFKDPQTGQTLIAAGGALESQIAGPPVNSTEMGHDQIDWVKVVTKLAYARPLALATNLPPDVAGAIAGKPTYGQLFAQAFGDTTVTAARVAFAVATYERTLVANQTPFDLGTLTPQQNQGFQAFQASRCIVCHAAPPNAQFFTDHSFRNIGLRPPAEDTGRQVLTGNANDRGRFKVPSLRNVGLRPQFMHNGEFTTLPALIAFYARAPGAAPQFPDNQDPVMQQVNVPPQAAAIIQDFIQNGLTDPRVRNEQFPFDRPTLYSQRPADQPINLGGGTPGTGGVIPTIIAADPPFVGNTNFRIGLDKALGGATARLVVSATPPDGLGTLLQDQVFDTKLTAGTVGTSAAGYATQFWSLKPSTITSGQTLYAQWLIDDPGAAGGVARSSVAQIRFFCGQAGCAPVCEADVNEDASVNVSDIFAFLGRWFSRDLRADLTADVTVNVGDIFEFLRAYFAGC